MFSELCTIVFILPVLFGIGSFTEFLFGKNILGISGTLLSGIFSVTVFWTALAFFFPLNIYTEIFTEIIGLALFFSFFKSKNFHFPKRKIAVLGAFLGLFLFVGSFSPFILDHFGYYLPSVKWLREFGFVKGVSNIDLTLGQMSFWHIFQAGLSNFSDPFLRINIIAVIIAAVYVFERKSWLHTLFFPFYFLYLQSPSPDLPAMVFGLMILNEILLRNRHSGWLFALSALVFGIKPTMIWLPIAVFLYGFIILKSSPRFLFAGACVFLIFIAKNLWLFGYPVFPVQAIDLNLAWKPNVENMRQSARFATMKTYDMKYSFAEIRDFSFLDFIKNWLLLPGIKGKINILFIAVLSLFAVFSLKKNQKIIWIIFFAIFIKSIFVLGFSAQYRFFTDVFLVVFFIIFYRKFSGKILISVSFFLSILVALIFSFPQVLQKNIPSFRVGKYMNGFRAGQLFTPGNYVINRYETYKIGNLQFHVTEDYPYNYDTALPAISAYNLEQNFKFGVFPQKIGKDLQEGFVSKKITGADKIKLGKIISGRKKNP